jgi:hypothetical protein
MTLIKFCLIVMRMITSGRVNKRAVLLGIIIIMQLPALGQNQRKIIIGKVNSDMGVAIAGATLKFKDAREGSSTDSLGCFSLRTLLQENRWLYCYCVGYQTDSLQVSLYGDSIRVAFQLKPRENELSEVTIRVRRKLPEYTRVYTLNDFDIVTTAGAVGDVAAALQTFPGASPAGNETGLFVHSGAAYETQAFFDGMLVKNAFGSRLPDVANRSRFSAFLFDKTTFTTGGYPARYGQALSSAFVMETKGLANTTSTEFSALSLGVGAAHTERFKNSSLMIGGNYYNFGLNNSLIKQNIAWKLDPRQYQSSLHYKLKTAGAGMLKIFADYSDTDLAFDIINPRSAGQDLLNNRNKNLYLNTNYQGPITPDWKIYAGAAYNHTRESGLVNADNYHQWDDVLQEKLSISRLFSNNSVITIGAESFQSRYQQGYTTTMYKYTDVLTAGFAESEVYIGKYLIVKVGLRGEYSTYLNRTNLSPRTSLLVTANARNRFTIAYGTYYTRPEDGLLARGNNIGYEKAAAYSLAYDFDSHYRNLHLEMYHKQYSHLVKFTTPVFSGFQAYGPPVYVSNMNNSGNGYARGFDVFWRDQRTFPGGEYYISYSFADTRRNYIDFPTSARPAFAPAHTFNVVARRFITAYRTQISGTYTYSSGRSYFNPLNPVFMGDRTRDFHNLSIGLSYLPGWIKEFSVINLTFSNILGFDQVYGYRYSYDGARRQTIRPPSKRGVLFSFLVNIGDGQFNH